MKKLLAVLFLMVFLAAGCGLFKKDPQKAVTEGVAKFAEVKQMTSSLIMSGVIQAPPGEKPGNVQFSIKVLAKTDTSDDAALKADVSSFRLDAVIDGQKTAGEIALKIIDKKMFVQIKNLEIPGEAGKALNEQLASVFNTWWSMPLNEKDKISQLTSQQKEIQDLLKTMQFFTNSREDGEEDIQGMKTYRYRADLNKEALKKFVLELARISGSQLTPEDELALTEKLKEIEASGAVWVGEDDYVHRIKGVIALQPTQGPTTSLDIDYAAWDYGEEVTVSAPEKSQEFNPLMLLPVLGAFGSLDLPAEEGTSTPADAPLGSQQVAPK